MESSPPTLDPLATLQVPPPSTVAQCGSGLAIVAVSLAAALSALYKHHTKRAITAVAFVAIHEPPFPSSSLPILDTTVELLANDHRLYDWLTDLCLEFHGRPFRIKALGLAPIVVLSSPAHMEQVLRTDFANFEKGPIFHDAMRDLLGDGIFAADGAAWYHQRKTLSHLFTARTLRESVTIVIHRHVADLVEVLDAHAETGSALDLGANLHDFTLDAIVDMTLGVSMRELRSDFQQAFDAAQRQVSLRMTVPAAYWKFQRFWNLGGEARLKQHMQTIDSAVLRVIHKSIQQRHDEPRRSSTPSPNLVSLFLDSVDTTQLETGAFDPTHLRDIVLNIMVAGRDTTAQTLAWFFHCLDQHPHVTQKIRDEIQRHAPELLATPSSEAARSAPTFASMEQVAKLSYLDAALKETLRLYPAVPFNIRATVRDTVLADGTLLPVGALVGLPTYALGRMPHVWGPHATAYDPDRWFDPATGKPIPVSAFQFNAFHGGPRQCIGQLLAMLEMKIVVVALLSRFNIAVEPGQDVTYARALTLPMKHPLMVKVVSRRQEQS